MQRAFPIGNKGIVFGDSDLAVSSRRLGRERRLSFRRIRHNVKKRLRVLKTDFVLAGEFSENCVRRCVFSVLNFAYTIAQSVAVGSLEVSGFVELITASISLCPQRVSQ